MTLYTDDNPIEVIKEINLVTENSIWVIRPDVYMRMPRMEMPRPERGEGLKDNLWTPYRAAFWHEGPSGKHARLIPSERPPGSVGCMTGVIQSIAGE